MGFVKRYQLSENDVVYCVGDKCTIEDILKHNESEFDITYKNDKNNEITLSSNIEVLKDIKTNDCYCHRENLNGQKFKIGVDGENVHFHSEDKCSLNKNFANDVIKFFSLNFTFYKNKNSFIYSQM